MEQRLRELLASLPDEERWAIEDCVAGLFAKDMEEFVGITEWPAEKIDTSAIKEDGVIDVELLTTAMETTAFMPTEKDQDNITLEEILPDLTMEEYQEIDTFARKVVGRRYEAKRENEEYTKRKLARLIFEYGERRAHMEDKLSRNDMLKIEALKQAMHFSANMGRPLSDILDYANEVYQYLRK